MPAMSTIHRLTYCESVPILILVCGILCGVWCLGNASSPDF